MSTLDPEDPRVAQIQEIFDELGLGWLVYGIGDAHSDAFGERCWFCESELTGPCRKVIWEDDRKYIRYQLICQDPTACALKKAVADADET